MTLSHDIWVIGDVQGCCQSLKELLKHPDLASDKNRELWFAGDIVNRGPQSLETIRHIMGMRKKAITVLGNHDLNLLAVAAGVRKPAKSDTIADILKAPDADKIITWLRHRPMAHYAHGHLLVHAGVLAKWDVHKTLALAAEVEAALRAPNWKRTLEKMYGNQPAEWSEDLGNNKRLRVIINALTRIRMCNRKGHMEFDYKNAPGDSTDADLIPWFDVPNRATAEHTVVFGHWSTLGLMIRPDAICLDTGCVWGGKLSAIRLQDHKLVQVSCKVSQKP